jgi:hypothetical protein
MEQIQIQSALRMGVISTVKCSNGRRQNAPYEYITRPLWSTGTTNSLLKHYKNDGLT